MLHYFSHIEKDLGIHVMICWPTLYPHVSYLEDAKVEFFLLNFARLMAAAAQKDRCLNGRKWCQLRERHLAWATRLLSDATCRGFPRRWTGRPLLFHPKKWTGGTRKNLGGLSKHEDLDIGETNDGVVFLQKWLFNVIILIKFETSPTCAECMDYLYYMKGEQATF